MKLQLFRDHLATELGNLPDVRTQEIQSYALTTAILTRSLVERLDIGDLRVGRARDPKGQTYPLTKILNNLIHYRAFHPEYKGPDDDPTDCVVRLYSDDAGKEGELYWISLRDYFDVVSRFAHDDFFVAQRLLRRVITCLHQLLNTNDKHSADFLRDIAAFVEDGLVLAANMDRDGQIQISADVFVDWYEGEFISLHEGFKWTKGPRISAPEFIHGFNSVWRMSPFTPSKNNLAAEDVYSIFIERVQRKEDGSPDFFVVSFRDLVAMFQDIKKQCDEG